MAAIEIILTYWEMEVAVATGCARYLSALKKGSNDDTKGNGWREYWASHIEGACGESAFAKWLDVYYLGHVDKYKGGDVGGIEVRTSLEHDGKLKIRPTDDDNRIVYLVTGRAPRFLIRGWILAKEGKRGEWWGTWDNRPGHWRVPQSVLNEPIHGHRAVVLVGGMRRKLAVA